MNEDLQKLEQLIRTLNWFISCAHEPNVGAPESSRLADNYGTRGQSLFTVFLEKKDGGVYKCAFERCSATFTRNLEGAIRHIRDHHFGHYPFSCGQWYVSHYSLRRGQNFPGGFNLYRRRGREMKGCDSMGAACAWPRQNWAEIEAVALSPRTGVHTRPIRQWLNGCRRYIAF